MGYLSIGSAPVGEFYQAIISFWFRAPQMSLDAVKAKYDADRSDPSPPFLGILPLVVLGKPGISQIPIYNGHEARQTVHDGGFNWSFPYPRSEVIDHGGDPLPPLTYDTIAFHYDATPWEEDHTVSVGIYWDVNQGPENPLEPTFIGVDCSQDPPTLLVNLETARKATVTGHISEIVTSIDPGVTWNGNSTLVGVRTEKYHYAFGIFQSSEVISDATSTIDVAGGTSATSTPPTYHRTDVGNLDYQSTQRFRANTTAETAAGEWHHVLVSFELRPCTTHGAAPGAGYSDPLSQYVDSAPSVWVAVDDVNLTGFDLSDDMVGEDVPNWILSDDAYSIAGENTPADGTQEHFDLPGANLPTSENSMGIPATGEFVDSIYDVDMAEFQMWVGQTLDTGNDGLRRLFIDDEGKPVKPAIAAKALGKPAILIHGSGSWKQGRNSGTSGVDEKGKINKDGQFDPTGTIIKFTPNPVLGVVVEPGNPDSKG